MITILPMDSSVRKDRLLQTIQGAEDNVEVLVMSEAGKELGYVVIDFKASTLRMLKMELFDNAILDGQCNMCADSMMRAAASYGTTVGAYQIESFVSAFDEQFQSCGFEPLEGRLLCSLKNIVKICNK